MSIKKYAVGAAFTFGLLLSSTMAQAATFSSCVSVVAPTYNIADNVTGTSNCTISSDTQDFQNTNPITVNGSPGFFSITDWIFGGKLGEVAGYNGTGTKVDAIKGTIGGTSGTWNISGVVQSTWESIMLVFKDGEGTTLVGYLLSATSGLWTSPFEEPPFSFNGASPKDVSHISVYYTLKECGGSGCSNPDPIPLPAGILLLISALGGLGILTRYRKAGAGA